MRASDHAVLRYLERVQGVDVEAARTAIERVFETSPMQAATQWARDRDSAYRVIRGDLVFCCRADTVTTCFPKRRPKLRKARGGPRPARSPARTARRVP